MNDDILCLVVSLQRSQERRLGIQKDLDDYGIPFEFIDAVDALDGLDPVNATRVDKQYAPHISDAEFACALSHQDAYQRFLESDCEYALILEDDAILLPELRDYLDRSLYHHAPMMLLFHLRARVYRTPPTPLIGHVGARALAMSCNSTVAYTLNRHAARQIQASNTPVRTTADWPMDITTLNAHVLEPYIVQHPPRVGGQSLLSDHRDGQQRARIDPIRYLRKSYLKRRWLKLRSTRIS